MNKKYNDKEYHKKLYKLDFLTMHDFFVVKKFKLFRRIKQPIIMTFGSRYFPSCIELWNALPYNIKSLTNSNEFLLPCNFIQAVYNFIYTSLYTLIQPLYQMQIV